MFEASLSEEVDEGVEIIDIGLSRGRELSESKYRYPNMDMSICAHIRKTPPIWSVWRQTRQMLPDFHI